MNDSMIEKAVKFDEWCSANIKKYTGTLWDDVNMHRLLYNDILLRLEKLEKMGVKDE